MKLGWVGLIVPDENNINTSLANSKNKINSVSANGNKMVIDRHCMSKLYDYKEHSWAFYDEQNLSKTYEYGNHQLQGKVETELWIDWWRYPNSKTF